MDYAFDVVDFFSAPSSSFILYIYNIPPSPRGLIIIINRKKERKKRPLQYKESRRLLINKYAQRSWLERKRNLNKNRMALWWKEKCFFSFLSFFLSIGQVPTYPSWINLRKSASYILIFVCIHLIPGLFSRHQGFIKISKSSLLFTFERGKTNRHAIYDIILLLRTSQRSSQVLSIFIQIIIICIIYSVYAFV